MGILKFIFFTLISIVLVVFCVENNFLVTISFFPSAYFAQLPLFVFAIICIAIGVIFGGFSAFGRIRKLKREIRQKTQREQSLENEVKNLRQSSETKLPSITKS